MADIHILEGTLQDEYVAIYRYVFHIPTNASAALKAKAVQDLAVSGFDSALDSLIAQAELDQIRAGDLVEEVGTISYHKNDQAADYLARLRSGWQDRAAAIPAEFERQYQWYGNEYAYE